MANVEDIVVSFDTAKKLVEKGICLKTVFVWEFTQDKEDIVALDLVRYWVYKKYPNHKSFYPAPTAEEIPLPFKVTSDKIEYDLYIDKRNDGWCFFYAECEYMDCIVPSQSDKKLCEAMAKILIVLKKSCLTDVKEDLCAEKTISNFQAL